MLEKLNIYIILMARPTLANIHEHTAVLLANALFDTPPIWRKETVALRNVRE